MKIKGKHYRTIWLKDGDPSTVCVIDQRLLPHRLEIVEIRSVADMAAAIKDMTVRGAPLIGVAAAYGMYLAALELSSRTPESSFRELLDDAAEKLLQSRPTAVNLAWAVAEQRAVIAAGGDAAQVIESLRVRAQELLEDDVSKCKNIGEHALRLFRELAARKGSQPLNILTHCNAGWLATVDWGTATAGIYLASEAGIPIHVWVDETRPRNQGASLTAWELGSHGVSYTLISDNAGGHLMQDGRVDLVIVGTDRVARNGDVANKIGTYLKALAAHANNVPFFVAAPSSSIDWQISSGRQIPIEERDSDEVKYVWGLSDRQEVQRVLISPEDAAAANFGFDVTPAHLITKLITERGVCDASEDGLLSLFPEKLVGSKL